MQYYLKMLLESMPFLMKQQQHGGRGMGNMGGPHQQRQGNFQNNRQVRPRPMGNQQMGGNRGGNMMHQGN
jgi:hypothetical protein